MTQEGTAEQAWIRQARTGDTQAFAALVQKYQSAIYNLTYRLLGDSEEAKDLAQEAFLRAYRALPTFQADKPFAPWLYRIATNLCLNWLAKRRLPTVSLDAALSADESAGTALGIGDHSSEPQALLERQECHTALRRAILALPPEQRAVIELRHFQDLSYQEIADVLGIPLSDVKSRLFRGRRWLAEALREFWSDDHLH
jgi:RNA polymerase sigma-70 factor (ECF subfamily)